jgi:LAS superfamily LD-carboxypeptidase LdcB
MLSLLLSTLMFGAPPDVTKLLAGYSKGTPIQIEAYSVPGKDLRGLEIYLRHDVAIAWIEMVEAAAKEGVHLAPNFGFRDHQLQKQLRKQNRRLAAKPGYSPHEAGIAIDIAGTVKRVRGRRTKTDAYNWLKLNASRFGFYQTIKKEPWHWQWVENETTEHLVSNYTLPSGLGYDQPSRTLPVPAILCKGLAL